MERLYFECDYQEGAHPLILKRLAETNMDHTIGYGVDAYSERARQKIREACGAENADVQFLFGGTQANMAVISAALRPYEGVIAPQSGHISIHEAGAIESTGHKVIELPQKDGKLCAAQIAEYMKLFNGDESKEHMVFPGMVYISQPTECGSLYSLSELEEMSEVCRREGLKLYVDGARMAYALSSRENDVSLKDLARLADVFYIGGTKCGALFGEAVVIPDPELIPHFFTMIKQRGALIAKGRITAIQFETLFTDGLYEKIGRTADVLADRIREALTEKGYELCWVNPTNQVFAIMDDERLAKFRENVECCFWEKTDEKRTAIRIATSWATTEEDVEKLVSLL